VNQSDPVPLYSLSNNNQTIIKGYTSFDRKDYNNTSLIHNNNNAPLLPGEFNML